MAGYVDAGSLRDRLAVLELQEVRPGEWAWVPVRPAWGAVTLRDKSNLFSQVGLGARDAGIVLRRQCLTLANALGWAHGHLFLTSIVDRGGGYLDVGAAVVRPCSCTAVRTAAPNVGAPPVATTSACGRPAVASASRTAVIMSK